VCQLELSGLPVGVSQVEAQVSGHGNGDTMSLGFMSPGLFGQSMSSPSHHSGSMGSKFELGGSMWRGSTNISAVPPISMHALSRVTSTTHTPGMGPLSNPLTPMQSPLTPAMTPFTHSTDFSSIGLLPAQAQSSSLSSPPTEEADGGMDEDEVDVEAEDVEDDASDVECEDRPSGGSGGPPSLAIRSAAGVAEAAAAAAAAIEEDIEDESDDEEEEDGDYEEQQPHDDDQYEEDDDDDHNSGRPIGDLMQWISASESRGADGRSVLRRLLNEYNHVSVPSRVLWKMAYSLGMHLQQQILAQQRRRLKLPHINTIEHVIELIKTSQNIVVLTGAGISVSAGQKHAHARTHTHSRAHTL